MHYSKFNIKRYSELPEEAYWNALEQFEDYRLQRSNLNKKLNISLIELKNAYRNEFFSVIGEKNRSRYEKIHKHHLNKIYSAKMRAPKTPAGF